MKTSRALKASRSLREGFAKAPRAPPFGNDSSDNDKPPGETSEAEIYKIYFVQYIKKQHTYTTI